MYFFMNLNFYQILKHVKNQFWKTSGLIGTIKYSNVIASVKILKRIKLSRPFKKLFNNHLEKVILSERPCTYITYESMLCKESAQNLFRMLMCRDINLHVVQGVIFYHACGLDQYILNREPREFAYLRWLLI
jgi:hypothetical protein